MAQEAKTPSPSPLQAYLRPIKDFFPKYRLKYRFLPGLDFLTNKNFCFKKIFSGILIMEDIVTAEELANYLRIKKSTIYLLAQQGKLPGFKFGKSWRFKMGEILMLWQGGKMEERTATTSEKNGATSP